MRNRKPECGMRNEELKASAIYRKNSLLNQLLNSPLTPPILNLDLNPVHHTPRKTDEVLD